MPTDLQASTSSTSSISKQTSLEDSYGLDKSRDEADLCKEMSALSNGFVYGRLCCTPIGMTCVYDDEALDRTAAERCKIVCSNQGCDQSGWIHVVCLKTWEQKIKADLLKLNPQMRIAIDRQRGINHWIDVLQNVMPHSFLCPCKQGTLRQLDKNISCGTTNAETSYFAGQPNQNRRKIGSNNQTTNQSGTTFNNNGSIKKNSLENNSSNSFNNYSKRLRSRTLSANQMMLNFTLDSHLISPTDFPKTKKDFLSSSVLKHQACTKLANGLMAQKNKGHNRQRHHSSNYHGSNSTSKDDSFSSNSPTTNSAGNIFKQRNDFKTFQKLPFSKQNAYFIQMEDDSCTGNDDTKVFLLTLLSKHGINMVHCLICSSKLPIYDHLPLVDGTFFLSPLSHSAGRSIPISASSHPPGSIGASIMNNTSYQHSSQQREKYLHVVCIHCMHEIVICCQFCHRPWTGAQLLIGSLYTYDIFAAVPCCLNRLSCNNCNGLCIDISNGGSADSKSSKSLTPSLSTLLSNFSQLSRLVECKNCHNRDYHFVKPFPEIYKPIGSYI